MISVALAGNPNCGKTTLFNALTGSNQYVGNWAGVTVEKKTGKTKDGKFNIVDLPGIYSLSPYSMEEIVSRDYIIKERPQAIINIIDGTNIERNLYLTVQLVELGIPMVLVINMMDDVKAQGTTIDFPLFLFPPEEEITLTRFSGRFHMLWKMGLLLLRLILTYTRKTP